MSEDLRTREYRVDSKALSINVAASLKEKKRKERKKKDVDMLTC